MSEEKVYTFNEYVLGYDSGGNNDRSCLTISKILNDNMYVMSTLHDGSAEVISTMLDALQQKVEQLEKENKELKYDCSCSFHDAEELNQKLTETIDERNELDTKLIQLENIRKEAIEYLKKREYDNYSCSVCSVISDDLLNILNKGDNKE